MNYHSFTKLDHLFMNLPYGSDHMYEGFNTHISMNDSLKTLLWLISTIIFYSPRRVRHLLHPADSHHTLLCPLLCQPAGGKRAYLVLQFYELRDHYSEHQQLKWHRDGRLKRRVKYIFCEFMDFFSSAFMNPKDFRGHIFNELSWLFLISVGIIQHIKSHRN